MIQTLSEDAPGTEPAGDTIADALGVLGRPYPQRGSVEQLGERVRGLLRGGGFSAGDRFFTDEELVAATGLSRSSVRRALGGLRDGGWLRRCAGRGTYVGRTQAADRGPEAVAGPAVRGAAAPLRLGVLAFNGRDPAHDWFTGDVMRGVSGLHGPAAGAASEAPDTDAADTRPVRIELLAGYADSLTASIARLEEAAPDVLVCLSASPDDAMLVRVAAERGMRCLVAGTMFPELDAPRTCEDNRSGVAMVVRELVERGHRRIGMAMRRWNGPWVFERHEQWLTSCRELGADAEEALMHWLPSREADLRSSRTDEALLAWIDHARPTAVICGHYAPAENLGHLARAGRLRIPEDLSVAVIDRQHPGVTRLLSPDASGAATPLREIGAQLAEQARGWLAGHPPPSLTRLPMRWHDGNTVRRI
ncbi:substrate-binding domain-containing protein [Phycisphaera mikurensis]|uniref:Putative GntR family transcriptional regulator n=1 Tax=Phycisphaera mikurensis (strain NBRC 102666 / KCTC 22515 / FYK2301M01) TaxID=1142394 RepID=I0ID17_PHYMF|nr:substrate-binding domain-containing protein [Phycisphaera mikurensis]MBB6442280.1 DNA-binding LacI/PurR family transcriptional regulator [Phycisphaera mikurensis]BAM03155.1 putative GntR family transcriptional regulator [Phycisphaera mikurensis NBRC 102666]